MRRAALVALALCVGCRARYRPVAEDASTSGVAVSDARADVSRDASDDVSDVSAFPSRVTVVAVSGACELATDSRCRGTSADAGANEPSPAREGDALFECERCDTRDGAATLAVEGGAHVSLSPHASVESVGYAGASLVVTAGVVTVSVPTLSAEPARIDTPAGRLIVSSGAALIAVCDDGATRVALEDGAATWWATPPPPRSADAVEGTSRAVLSLPLAPGAMVAYARDGSPQRRGLRRASGEALRRAWTAWIQSRASDMLVPDSRAFAIGDLDRAGAGDVADLRAALDRLHGATALEARERDALVARASLALGRLTARARIARSLNDLAGDANGCPHLDPLEELRAVMR